MATDLGELECARLELAQLRTEKKLAEARAQQLAKNLQERDLEMEDLERIFGRRPPPASQKGASHSHTFVEEGQIARQPVSRAKALSGTGRLFHFVDLIQDSITARKAIIPSLCTHYMAYWITSSWKPLQIGQIVLLPLHPKIDQSRAQYKFRMAIFR